MRRWSNLNKRTSENKTVKCLDSDFLEGDGKILDFRDIMIASIVKCHGLTLVTRNVEHKFMG